MQYFIRRQWSDVDNMETTAFFVTSTLSSHMHTLMDNINPGAKTRPHKLASAEHRNGWLNVRDNERKAWGRISRAFLSSNYLLADRWIEIVIRPEDGLFTLWNETWTVSEPNELSIRDSYKCLIMTQSLVYTWTDARISLSKWFKIFLPVKNFKLSGPSPVFGNSKCGSQTEITRHIFCEFYPDVRVCLLGTSRCPKVLFLWLQPIT